VYRRRRRRPIAKVATAVRMARLMGGVERVKPQ